MSQDAPTLSELRHAAGLSMAQLGLLAGCTDARICHYDHRREPLGGFARDLITRIAEVLAERLSWERVLPWQLAMGVIPVPFRDPEAIELDWDVAHPDLRDAMHSLAHHPNEQQRIAALLRKELATLSAQRRPGQTSPRSAA